MANPSGLWVLEVTESTIANLNACLLQKSVIASREAAAYEGLVHFASDTLELSRDTGVAWEDAILVDAVVGVASFRTLGTGARQASAGSHTH